MATPTYPLKKINYLSKDFLTLRDELLQTLPIITGGRYSNINESDPGIAILEVFMSMVDNLMFYQDMMAQEVYFPTARQRNNVIKLLRLIGYEFNSVTAATGTVTVAVQSNAFPYYPVTIASGSQFSAQSETTNQTLIFTSTQSVSLSSSSDTKTIPVIQGVSTTETFTSDGSPSQKFSMGNSSIDKTTVTVSVSTSPLDNTSTVPWTVVSSFYVSEFDDPHFKVEIDEFSRVSVIFGDGQFGKIPPVGTNILVNYFVTEGSTGNVGNNAINSVVSSAPLIVDNLGGTVALSIVGSQGTAGGADIESIEHAKQTAQGLLFGLRRALSRDDFASLTLSIPGVDKAVAWGENEESNPDYRLYNKVRVCFFSKTLADMYYNPANRASYRSLRDFSVKPLLLNRMPITARLVFVDPIFVDIFVTLRLGIDSVNNDSNVVIDQVKSALLDFYSYDNISFGQDIRISDILSTVNNVQGIKWSSVTRLAKTPPNTVPDSAPQPPIDIVINKWEIATLLDINISPASVANTNLGTNYLEVTVPSSTNIGINDIIVINPDEQSNALANAFTFYPSPLDQHITVDFTSTTDQPSPDGGYYGNPTPESDSPIYTSNQ